MTGFEPVVETLRKPKGESLAQHSPRDGETHLHRKRLPGCVSQPPLLAEVQPLSMKTQTKKPPCLAAEQLFDFASVVVYITTATVAKL
ncbi:MAG: hypothetical protein JWP44_4365 [Mucilaginibacter sp.]|nr:hypothetical protein [Mucilaginibacter sp.]